MNVLLVYLTSIDYKRQDIKLPQIRSILFAFSFLFTFCIITALSGCGGSDNGGPPTSSKQAEASLPTRIAAAEKSMQQLDSAIKSGLIRNALILKEYASILQTQKPKLRALIDNLALDAGNDGAIYKNLQNRLATLKNEPDLFETPLARYQEANAIIDASQPEIYNLSLIDVVNVLADMSDGSLPRIESQSKNETLAANRSEDMGAGSQLIGNPSYGQWTNNGGTSVWAWYGMYSMFRDLTGGRSYGYNQWNNNRDWSYYNDVGRERHGNLRNKSVNPPKSKKYGSKRDYGVNKKSYGSASSERRKSSYGGSGSSDSSKKSEFSKKSSAPASFRNRSTYSRSGFGGK